MMNKNKTDGVPKFKIGEEGYPRSPFEKSFTVIKIKDIVISEDYEKNKYYHYILDSYGEDIKISVQFIDELFYTKNEYVLFGNKVK